MYSYSSSDFSTVSFFFLAPDVFFLFCILVLLAFCIVKRKWHKHIEFTNFITILCMVCIFLVSIVIFSSFNVFGDSYFSFTILNENFIVSPFVGYCKLFVLIILFCFFLLSLDYFKYERLPLFEFPLLVMIAVWGMFLVISSNDFFILFLGLEIQSLVFYILAGLRKFSNISIEASLKYFILGSFSSCLILFGISVIYGFFGTLNFSNISELFLVSPDFLQLDGFYLVFGFFLVLVGLLFKMAIFPFHF